MNRYKKSRLIVVISFIVILSCSLLFLTTRGNGFEQGVFSGIRNTLSTVEAFFSQPAQLFTKQKEGMVELLAAYEENKQLKQSLSSLESQLLETETLKAENESLRQSLNMQGSYPDKTFITTSVTVRLPISWTNQIVIGAGTASGIQKDMLVMANGGLLGLVESVEEQSATVKLLTNSDEFTKIPIKITVNDKAIYGILSGYDTDQQAFIVGQLNSQDDIPLESSVVTSDLGGSTPSNLQIGTVLSIKQRSGSLDRELFIKPLASFDTIYSVSVVGE